MTYRGERTRTRLVKLKYQRATTKDASRGCTSLERCSSSLPGARVYLNSPRGAARMYAALSRCKWLMKLRSLLFAFYAREDARTEDRVARIPRDLRAGNFCSLCSFPSSRSVAPSPGNLQSCFSRLVPCGLLEGHRRIISPRSGRIGGGLRVGCPLSRCIQMMNYKYRSEPAGREGRRDRRRKGSPENYSRHAARKKRIYE